MGQTKLQNLLNELGALKEKGLPNKKSEEKQLLQQQQLQLQKEKLLKQEEELRNLRDEIIREKQQTDQLKIE